MATLDAIQRHQSTTGDAQRSLNYTWITMPACNGMGSSMWS